MAHIYLIREDQPLGDTQIELRCWKLDIPTGKTWPEVATQFATDNSFPIGAIASVIDPTVSGAVQSFILEQQWASYTS